MRRNPDDYDDQEDDAYMHDNEEDEDSLLLPVDQLLAIYEDVVKMCYVVQNAPYISMKNLVFKNCQSNPSMVTKLIISVMQYYPLIKKINEDVYNQTRTVQKPFRIKDRFLKNPFLFDVDAIPTWYHYYPFIFEFAISDERRKTLKRFKSEYESESDESEDIVLQCVKKRKAMKKCIRQLNAQYNKKELKDWIPKHLKAAQVGSKPKYVHVNTHVGDETALLQDFDEAGLVETPYKDMIDALKNDDMKAPTCYAKDPHIEGLFLVASSTRTHQFQSIQQGQAFIMDKSSHLPVWILKEVLRKDNIYHKKQKGGRGPLHVLDATAAPGNKSIVAGEYMKRVNANVFSIERDERRFGTLQQRLETLQCQNVTPIHGDFLKAFPANGDERIANARIIILDPSCSGSGMLTRLIFEEEKKDVVRVKRLQSFQALMLKHSLSHFPNVDYVMYSTCSVHPEENEEVIAEALDRHEEWELVPVFPEWPTRGYPQYMPHGGAENLIRVERGQNFMGGFFVACFKRIGPTPKRSDRNPNHRDNRKNMYQQQRRRPDARGNVHKQHQRKRKDRGNVPAFARSMANGRPSKKMKSS